MFVGMIVAISEDGVIGVDGGLPMHCPEDLKHFKQTTMGCCLIVGQKTLAGLPSPLPGRRVLAVSRSNGPMRSVEDAIHHLASLGEERVWIAGGAGVYQEGLQFADQVLITRLPVTVGRRDAIRFPFGPSGLKDYGFYLADVSCLDDGTYVEDWRHWGWV